jgi:hypothetical protein
MTKDIMGPEISGKKQSNSEDGTRLLRYFKKLFWLIVHVKILKF